MHPCIPVVPRFERHADLSNGVLDALGGEPLVNSGFESEDPEPDFEERS